jgi:hypothetical protein
MDKTLWIKTKAIEPFDSEQRFRSSEGIYAQSDTFDERLTAAKVSDSKTTEIRSAIQQAIKQPAQSFLIDNVILDDDQLRTLGFLNS